MYLAAVDRQEARAWAKWTDPAKDAELTEKLKAVRDWLISEMGAELGPAPDIPAERDPDPALFDTAEDIRRDDRIITMFLSDNPTEPRKPMARGTTHDELLEFWKKSSDGRNYFEQRDRQISKAVERAKAKVLGDG
jgi:hypothetical protein